MTQIHKPLLILVLGAAAAGCGKDDAPDLSRFVGTWSPAAAALTILCTDHHAQAIPVIEPTVIAVGASSDLLDTDATCPIEYDVISSSIARAQPGQSCDRPDVVTRMHIMEDTFTTDDGLMAMHTSSGRIDGYINISLGETVQCNFTETGTYRRGGN